MMNTIEAGKAGALFSDFLKEQGTYEEATEHAVKRVVAYQLDRLLDPDNDKVTLATLSRAARAVGRALTIELR